MGRVDFSSIARKSRERSIAAEAKWILRVTRAKDERGLRGSLVVGLFFKILRDNRLIGLLLLFIHNRLIGYAPTLSRGFYYPLLISFYFFVLFCLLSCGFVINFPFCPNFIKFARKFDFLRFLRLFRAFTAFYPEFLACRQHNFFVKKQQKTKKSIDNLRFAYYTIVME